MGITNIIIIKNLQYFVLSAIIVFALFALIIKNIKKKFIFLTLFVLFAQIYDFTLYYGDLFFLFFIPIILFVVIFYLQNLQTDTYIFKNINNEEISETGDLKTDPDKNVFRKEMTEKVFRFVMPVLFCTGFIFLFIKFSGNYTAKFNLEKAITLINFSAIAKEIYLNYGILIFLVILLIFILLLWIISIILIRKKK
ncbi:MAG: hypothetical protein ACYCZ1_10495 [Candidatus Humimicrobiaceae bacterium]